MDNNQIIKPTGNGLIQKVGNAISVINKLLATTEPQLIPYRKKDKWGFCTPDKKIVIDCVYHFANQFTQGLAWVVNSQRKGSFINVNGNPIHPFVFGMSSPFKEGLAKISLNNKFGYLNQNGIIAIPAIYEDASCFSNGLASVCVNEKYGYIDKNGKLVIPCIYDLACDFSNGKALVDIDDNSFWIDKNGNKTEQIFNEKQDSLLDIKKDNKYGFIDINGILVIEYKYEKVGCFENGYAYVVEKGKYGFINKAGESVVECLYDDAFPFYLGLALVTKNNNDGFIDLKGNEYWED